MWERIKQRWKTWQSGVGDLSLERHLRAHLSANGFGGRLARFDRPKLVAIERPGWVQVFQVDVAARRTAETEELPDREFVRLFGIVREDERKGRPSIQFFETASERDRLMEEWSKGLIRSPRFR